MSLASTAWAASSVPYSLECSQRRYVFAAPLSLQFLGATTTLVYSGGMTFIIVKVLDRVIGLRVTLKEEANGLNLSLHDEKGFSL